MGRCQKYRKEHFYSNKKRFLLVIVMALSFNFFIYNLIVKDASFQWSRQIFTFVSFLIVTEVIFLFDKVIGKRLPWHLKVRKRVLLLVSFSVIWIALMRLWVPLVEPFFVPQMLTDPEIYDLAFAIGVLFLIIYIVLVVASNYNLSLNEFVVENEHLKKEKLESDYKALQDQLNPHFLFNNLSTLIAIIRKDTDLAISFTESFTDVYRYVLKSKEEVAVTLQDELVFLEAYIALHKARIGEGLTVDVAVDQVLLHKKIPPLSLQILVENAIKHNITARSKPLTVTVGNRGETLFVSNNKQLKASTYSTNTGLANLGRRLKILTDDELKVVSNEAVFMVEIPLL